MQDITIYFGQAADTPIKSWPTFAIAGRETLLQGGGCRNDTAVCPGRAMRGLTRF